MNRLARLTLLTVALLAVFTVCAGGAVARLLPPRLALFQMPGISGKGLAGPGPGLPPVGGTTQAGRRGQATSAGVAARIAGPIGSGQLGPDVGALVTNLSTGKVLYQLNAATGFIPASTTKIATAVAAIDVLGPEARFTTSVIMRPPGKGTARGGATRTIVLVGGGDPVLAAGPYPPGSYPRPATLASLARLASTALRAKGVTSVRLRYDDAIFAGPSQAPGWPAFGSPDNYISTGNVTIIAALEVDQGRLTASGKPEDSDDPANYRPRSMTPSRDAAGAFAAFLRKDGITVRSAIGPGPSGNGGVVAAVHSPPLGQIVQQMLTESNNVIAETLARHVAIATGRPGTFSGGAGAVMATDRALKVTGLHLVDGSGLSPLDRITPRALISLVRLAAGAGPLRLRPVITGMPVAGFSGTLGPGSFFGPFGSAALGRVRAKTGNLNGVATMTGIAYTESGQLLAFAFMGNHIPAKLGVRPESALAQLATALAGCGCG